MKYAIGNGSGSSHLHVRLIPESTEEQTGLNALDEDFIHKELRRIVSKESPASSIVQVDPIDKYEFHVQTQRSKGLG